MGEEPFEGAYEGIMGVLDDPKKAYCRHFCSTAISGQASFMHREDMTRVYADLNDRSEKLSYFQDSCAISSSDLDPVIDIAFVDTKGLI